MRVRDIKIGDTYNQIQIISDLGYRKPIHRYACRCMLCGKEFEISAKHIGKTKTCRECSERSKIIDISGCRFGRLTAIERTGRTLTPNGTRQSMWKCRCDCGNETIVKYIALTSGNTRSCGCLGDENRKNTRFKKRRSVSTGFEFQGNLVNHPLRKIWQSMLMRCNNPNVIGYKNYGGRGIKVCNRWSGYLGFENFVNDMGERPTPEHTLDRIDYNGDYEPSNCRWATVDEQANNRTDNIYIIVGDRKITAKQFCKALGLNYWVAIKQIQRGYDVNVIAKDLRFNQGVYRRRRDLINHNRVISDEIAELLTHRIDATKNIE